uniref:Putative tail protein n=1 Tax=Siphoviridae sp. ct8aS59 TaxID=2825365 RepID=A0A8S5TSY8_9CAUD|nr:MAG TPA: putative tail protein [Siphoviridae sp. ct8aS59]
MKATLYKTLSNEKTPIEVKAGQTVREALPDFDLENAIILINGKIKNPDYRLKENDTATIRLTPSGTVALIVTLVVVAVVAVSAAVVGGVQAYKAKQAAEKAQEELEKVKKLTNKSDIDNRPFLRGASNTLATGNSQPYIIGRHFFTPYLLSKPFYQITGEDGADEYTYTALECGFNKQILQTVAIDDIKIKTFNSNTPQEGAYNIDAGIFAKDGKIEIAQDGALLTALPALNYKTESSACNDEIPHDSDVEAGTQEYLTYTLNPYAKDVDIAITFPYGLYAMNNDGDKIETQTTITPQYSLDGGATWHSFTFNNNGTATNTFKRNVSTKELRYVAHKDFTAADYAAVKANGANAIYIRVRNGGNAGDSMIHNDCYVLYYQSVCFDPDKSAGELVPCKIVEDRERAFCTILGLKLKATKINEDKLKKINIVTHGIARTWNGTTWSATKTATRNPAAWVLEIETSPSHPASRRADSELDLESLGEYYEHCEINGYKFDWTITQNTKKDDVLNYIMEATGACIYYDIYGRRAIAIDRPQENALAVYNPQNIINIQNKKTFGRRTDGLRIKYINSKGDLYQEDTYLVMREGQTLNQDSLIKDITVTGITTFEHIVKYARRLMAIEVLRPKTTIIEAGNEGVFYTPFSKILVQDDSLKIGIGKGFTIRDCEWRSGLLKKIYTNEPLTFDPAKTYGIIANCFTADGVKPVSIKVSGTGTTNELTVNTQIRTSANAKPEQGNIFSFGELDENGEFSKVTTEYIISQIKRSEKGFNLEVVNYNEAIYDSGTIPDYKSNITERKTAGKKGIPADTVTHAELEETEKLAIDAANEAAAVVTQGVHFTQVHKIKDIHGIGDTIESLRAALDDVLRQANNGISVTDDKITLQVADSEQKTRALIELTNDRIVEAVEDMSENVYSAIEILKNQIIAMVDDDARNAQAGISIRADEIILQVENTESELRSTIDMTAGEILAQVDDMKSELTGLIDVQAGAVTALVEGGGAQGQMSLSLELPVIIDATTRAKFVQAASEGEVSAVYAQLEGTSGESIKYAIKGNASNAAVKALWDKAVAAALIASQIDLTATQINIAAEHVVITGSTNHGQTIIEGGKIRAALIEVEDLLAKNVKLKNGGSLRSNNFDGTVNANGQITADGTSGWAIDNAGKVIFNNAKIRGEINATTGTLNNVTVNGFYTSNNTPFQPMAMINIGYNDGTLQLTNNKNIKSVTRNETGVFTLSLKKGVWLKTHSYNGYNYIDVFVIGNAADTFVAGFKNMLLMTPNWLRNYVNGRLTQNNGYAYVDYVILYFTDNNSDQLIDPKSAQCFIFGTESD